MQTKTVTADFVLSNDCTFEMLQELCLHKDFGGMSEVQCTTYAKQELKKGGKGNGGKSNGSGDLPNAKLRTILVKKLQDSPDQGEVFKAGNMQFEFVCLPDLDINSAGSNKAKRTSSGAKASVSGPLKGPYKVVDKTRFKATAETDPGKWEIWQHIWACSSFEEFFNKCPKKGVTRTQRAISASSEMRWAVKCGWIVPVQQEQQ